MRTISPNSRIIRGFKFFFCSLIFIFYFFLKWTQITYIIKMLKIDFVLNTVIAKQVSYYFFLQKHLLESTTKIKPRCLYHLQKLKKCSIFLHQIWINEYKGKHVKGSKRMGSWPISSLSALLLVPSLSKRYSFCFYCWISIIIL